MIDVPVISPAVQDLLTHLADAPQAKARGKLVATTARRFDQLMRSAQNEIEVLTSRTESAERECTRLRFELAKLTTLMNEREDQ